MAEPKSQRAICLAFECLYDRYAREKLVQVYRILVPAESDPIQRITENLSISRTCIATSGFFLPFSQARQSFSSNPRMLELMPSCPRASQATRFAVSRRPGCALQKIPGRRGSALPTGFFQKR